MKDTKCPSCNAHLTFEPGTTNLKCPYCGKEVPIVAKKAKIRETDFAEFLSHMESAADLQDIEAVPCQECGAQIQLPPEVSADVCPFCAAPLFSEKKVAKKAVRPGYLLPFGAARSEINNLFKDWINGLWFAPGNLKKLARTEKGVTGIYVPYWTYDADTSTAYTGQRGEFYYEPETVLVERNGRQVTETRMVQKIRWYPAAGTVLLSFDDVLVMASKSLPRDYAESLEPWDLQNLATFDHRYLSGLISETYQIGLKEGFELAGARMVEPIEQAIRTDIGGDVQQIESLDTRYSNITFKHILLPVWISAYRYRDKLYRFLVNARTRAIQGERPWSWIKIGLFAAGVAVAAYAFLVASGALQ